MFRAIALVGLAMAGMWLMTMTYLVTSTLVWEWKMRRMDGLIAQLIDEENNK